MQIILGWILLLIPGILVIGQLITVINFPLAQRLGLQEKTLNADPLWLRAEHHTACWDLVSLIWLPIAGILMIINHSWWPLCSLIGGAAYFDTAGREMAKSISLRTEGIKTGSDKEQRLHHAACITMGILGLSAIIYSLNYLASSL